jgi:hypothetical protein
MLSKLDYTVSLELLKEASNSIPYSNNGVSINQPTGDFFYDPWVIKEEFKNTVWEQLLGSLPVNYGEARIITLKHGTCYHSHADIDDRYHLNIAGQYSFLINLEKKEMFETTADGIWYEMDAGPRHSAVNYGHIDRTQLVVRKLLTRNSLNDAVPIKIISSGVDTNLSRFNFDNSVSTWLNRASKENKITNFGYKLHDVFLEIEEQYLKELIDILPESVSVVKI